MAHDRLRAVLFYSRGLTCHCGPCGWRLGAVFFDWGPLWRGPYQNKKAEPGRPRAKGSRHGPRAGRCVGARRRPRPGRPEGRKAGKAGKTNNLALAAFAHDIRTSLTGLLALGELLASSSIGERERDWAVAIKIGAEHLSALTALMVDAAKVHTGALILRRGERRQVFGADLDCNRPLALTMLELRAIPPSRCKQHADVVREHREGQIVRLPAFQAFLAFLALAARADASARSSGAPAVFRLLFYGPRHSSPWNPGATAWPATA